MRYIISLYIIFISFIPESRGQYPYVQVLSREKGFGNSNISCLLEDHQGVIWAGTQLGLLRFDGLQTTVFLPVKGDTNSISNENVYYILEDNDYNLWIGTRNGLNRIDPSRKKITRFLSNPADESTIPNNWVFQLVPFSDSTLFTVCYLNALSLINQRTGKVTRLNPLVESKIKPYLNGEMEVLDVLTTSNNFIFVNTKSAFFQYDVEHNKVIDVQDTITGIDKLPFFNNICLTKDGIIWFTDRNGILYKWLPYQFLTPYDDTALKAEYKIGNFWIRDYNRQNILISTTNNYFLVDKENGHVEALKLREDQNNIITYGQITCSLELSNGTVTLGATNGNLYFIDPLLQQFKYKNLINDNSQTEKYIRISDLFEDRKFNKRYFSAVNDSVFFVEDLLTGEVKSIFKPRVSSTANKWKLDQLGRLWLSDGTGVLEVDRINQSYKRYSPSSNGFNMFDMVEISPGNFIVGSFSGSLYRFEPDAHIFEIIPKEKGWIGTQIYCLKMDVKQQSVWIGTIHEGVYRYDVRRDTFFHYKNQLRNPYSISGDFVKDITIDSIGSVWFVNDPGGLSRFDYWACSDSAFHNFSREDGLPTNFLTGLATDKNGLIWMTSLNGIASLNPYDFKINLYSKADGLPVNRFAQSSLSVTDNNIVLLGTRNGYIYFNPDSLMVNDVPPGIVINDVLVFDKSRLMRNSAFDFVPLRLSYKENYLTIQFSVINYTIPELNSVKYILEGFDDDWKIRSGINQVSYTKVPPGKYTFRIMAANNDGIWNPREQSLAIVIRPPVWQRTWFYILIGVFVSSIVFAFYSYRFRQKLKQKLLIAEKEWLKNESEQQLTQLEMKALRAQMNPHFIFNCLNSINRFIVVNDNDSASEYLTKFARLIRQVLDNSRGEKVSLLTEIETLKLYIEMEFLRFANKFEYQIIVQPGLEPEKYVVQPMLIQPYVENAIWHGLMHRKEKGILRINFSQLENSLLVVIEDNGVGRTIAKKIKDSQLITRKSHGMQVTAERMSLLSQRMKVPVEAIVDDLFDDNHQSLGTKVSITLPLEPI